MKQTVIDTNGTEWRVDCVLDADSKNQIYPGYRQVNLSPVGSNSQNHRAVTIPATLCAQWLNGEIKVKVS